MMCWGSFHLELSYDSYNLPPLHNAFPRFRSSTRSSSLCTQKCSSRKTLTEESLNGLGLRPLLWIYMDFHTFYSSTNIFPCAGHLLCLSGLLPSSQSSLALCTLQQNNSLLHFVLVLFPTCPRYRGCLHGCLPRVICLKCAPWTACGGGNNVLLLWMPLDVCCSCPGDPQNPCGKCWARLAATTDPSEGLEQPPEMFSAQSTGQCR